MVDDISKQYDEINGNLNELKYIFPLYHWLKIIFKARMECSV